MRKSTVFRIVLTDDSRIVQKSQMHLDYLTAKLATCHAASDSAGARVPDVDLKPARTVYPLTARSHPEPVAITSTVIARMPARPR